MTRFAIYLFLLTWPLYVESVYIDAIVWNPAPYLPAIDIIRVYSVLIIILSFSYTYFNRVKIKLDGIIVATIAYILYFSINVCLNATGRGIATSLVNMFENLMIPIAIYFAINNCQKGLNKKTLARITLLAGLYISGVGLLEFIVGHNVIGPENLKADTLSRIFRTNGPFWDIIGYAGVCLIFVPFAHYAMKEKLVNSPFAYFCIISCSIGAIVSYARIIWIVLFLIYLVILSGRGMQRYFVIIFGILFIGSLLFLFADNILDTPLYKTRISHTRDITGRYAQYMDSLKLFIKSPVFGMGYEMYTETHMLALHNSFLRILVEFGLFGFMFYIVMIGSILLHNIKYILRKSIWHALETKISIFIIVLLVANTVDLLGNSNFMLILIIVTGIISVTVESGVVSVTPNTQAPHLRTSYIPLATAPSSTDAGGSRCSPRTTSVASPEPARQSPAG